VGDCQQRHRHQEFLRFMRSVVKQVDRKLQIHVILDNYATHKHAKVNAWLKRNKRVHFHFVPTSSSWLNLIERFFAELSQRQLKRLAVTSVDELIAAITAYIETGTRRRNRSPGLPP
jgi:transposase